MIACTHSRLGLVALALVATLLPACPGAIDDDGRLGVVVSVVPHAWLVERIGGEHVNVASLAGPVDSPATYQPTDSQVTGALRARVYFRTGVQFERGKWLAAIEAAEGVRIVDLREGIELRGMAVHHHEGEERGHEEEPEGGQDPHIWLSPALLRVQADTVCAKLSELDPSHAAVFRGNLVILTAELEALDSEIREMLAPLERRSFYVFHPAWGYFCDAYGLTQVPVELEGKEPSESELTALVVRARRDGIRVLFVQSQITGQSAKAVAQAVGAEVRFLDPLSRDVPANLRDVARAVSESAR